MRALWIKNLSLHLAEIGGSSSIDSRITDLSAMIQHEGKRKSIPETSIHFPGSILPWFGRTVYDYTIITMVVFGLLICATTPTFAAVVLTLNATGWELLFVMDSVHRPVEVSGPGNNQ